MAKKWTEDKGVGEYEMWDKDEEKEIEGLLVEKVTGVGPNNSNVYVLEDVGGERKGVWGTAILDQRFKNKPIGTEVKIVYKGKVKGKTGTRYHDFGFFYDKETMPESDKMDEVLADVTE
jgi:hypothetical protein